jgi:hypothetical protein
VFVESEVLIATLIKNSVYWAVTPCILAQSTDVSEEYVASMFRVEE